MSNMW